MFIKLQKNQKGFTLVEIMIVVAIIGLLAAIAIPNLLRARVNSNEAAARGALRTLSSALESYRGATGAFPDDLDTLTSTTPPYIDSELGAGEKHGYTFEFTVGDSNQAYALAATPLSVGVTGSQDFAMDESGVITASAAEGAGEGEE